MFTEDATASDDERMWETVYIKREEVKNWSIAREGSTGECTISRIRTHCLLIAYKRIRNLHV